MVHNHKNTSECAICYEDKQKINLGCPHSFCKDCLDSCINSQYQHKLSCPLCRRVTYNTTDSDINDKIYIIELYRDNEYDEYDEYNSIYYDEFHMWFCLIRMRWDNFHSQYKHPKYNPRLNKKCINGQVIKFSYS